jgi:hypothetical protein
MFDCLVITRQEKHLKKPTSPFQINANLLQRRKNGNNKKYRFLFVIFTFRVRLSLQRKFISIGLQIFQSQEMQGE